MITLLKSNIVGARDVVSIMYVELLFDVKTELPDKFYQINGKNFLIADGSLAIKTFINNKNESDTIVYKYNNSKWIKTADKYTGIITPISTITENGKYSIGSNNTIGTNNIDVNVESSSGGGGLEFSQISYTINSYGSIDSIAKSIDGLGTYKLQLSYRDPDIESFTLIEPAVLISNDRGAPNMFVQFTPANNFIGIGEFKNNVFTPYTLKGDTIEPGDGKYYTAQWPANIDYQSCNITKYDIDFFVQIK